MKIILFALLLSGLLPFMSVATNSADGLTPIPFNTSYVDPTKPQNPHQKSPIQAPVIYLDGYTLDFLSCCDGSTLRLLDDTKTVVYFLVIPKGTTLLNLPASLEGAYTIQIICGNWLFTGEIELN